LVQELRIADCHMVMLGYEFRPALPFHNCNHLGGNPVGAVETGRGPLPQKEGFATSGFALLPPAPALVLARRGRKGWRVLAKGCAGV